jgi:isoprenylcysteine carboxyl methyltransferase (ICMT) family protein YpbQ
MAKAENKKAETSTKNVDFVFGKENYKFLIIGVVVVLLGFILMSGTEDILDFRKITLAPIVVILGFVIVTYGILKKPRD